ncbi:MAG: hypothetical protein ACR2NN_26970 [Bryobacteraceae bacterium]
MRERVTFMTDLAQQRHRAHAYLDCLRGDQLSAVYGLLASMLSALDRKLALAPIDDEPVPEEFRKMGQTPSRHPSH